MVAVVVIDHRAPDLTERCIRSLPKGVNVILIDNSETNRGFAAGCNAGIKQALDAGADYVWLLNNDAIVQPDALDRLLAKVKNGVGAVGSIMLNSDGTIQVWGGGRVGIGRSIVAKVPDRLTWLSACSLLLTREALERTGGFDEGFFMYWEDVDLSYRIRAAGLELAVAEDAFVIHLGGATARHSPRSLIRFFRKRSVLWPLHVSIAAILSVVHRLMRLVNRGG